MPSAGVNGRAVEEEGPPEPLPGQGAAVAVVVAHPDDESLWAGGLLLSHPEWRVFVAALSRRSDTDRAPKFYLALRRLGADGALGDLDDGPDQRPLSEAEVASQVLSLLPAGVYDLVVTHSPRGEYTRHRRHEEAAQAVLRLWRERTLRAKAFWTFAYEDGGGAYLPRAEEGASFTLSLPEAVWAEKRRIITDIYGFQEESWEARTVPRREAFWRAGASEDPDPAMGACKAGGNRGGVRGCISKRVSPINRLLKNSRGSRCQRHGPGCKAPRRRRCLAHRLGAATQQAGPCRGNPSGAKDWGPSALLRLLGRGPTLPSSPRLAYGPQASCARPMRVSQQPVKGLGPPPSLARRLQGWGGVPGGLCPRGGEGTALPVSEVTPQTPKATGISKARELRRVIGENQEFWAREVAAHP